MIPTTDYDDDGTDDDHVNGDDGKDEGNDEQVLMTMAVSWSRAEPNANGGPPAVRRR